MLYLYLPYLPGSAFSLYSASPRALAQKVFFYFSVLVELPVLFRLTCVIPNVDCIASPEMDGRINMIITQDPANRRGKMKVYTLTGEKSKP